MLQRFGSIIELIHFVLSRTVESIFLEGYFAFATTVIWTRRQDVNGGFVAGTTALRS